MKYRKKPIIIEAYRWFENGDHPEDYTNQPPKAKREMWEGNIVRRFRHPDISGSIRCIECGNIMINHGWIDTKEGGHRVCPGDYIITGIKSEHYLCKPDIFEATYDKL